ncbi:MAG: RAMP superfamily CRISPR-associated protein, partial [Fidelibacterota bacterium]
SADDDHYYIIDNPVLKEKVFKVPMMRGSSWKGVLSTAIRSIMKKNKNDLIENYLSFVRLFGAGSEEFRKMIDLVSEKEIKNNDFQKKLRWYALTKLGKSINLTDNNLDKKILDEIKQKSLQVRRGRLIFYPTYFNKLGLEMINPHKRRTKAGTNPVYYEVVTKGASGIFQLLYIPADGIAQSEHKLKEEVEKDLDLLTNGLKRIFQEQQNDAQVKIGAKTKLGWGRVKADHLDFIRRKEDSLNSPDSSFLKEYSGGAE